MHTVFDDDNRIFDSICAGADGYLLKKSSPLQLVNVLLVKGNSYKMIAANMEVSIDTVKKHLQNIYHKLHVNCGTEAVAKVLRHKIVSPDQH